MRAGDVKEEREERRPKDDKGQSKHAASDQTLIVGPAISTSAGEIYEWVPCAENLPNYPTIAFFGKRRTGKSTSGMNIMFHAMRDIPFGIVMSNTAYAGYFEKFVPKRFIVQGLRQDVLTWLVKRQKRLIRKYGIEDKKKVGAFIILDDVIADQKAMRWNVNLNSFFVEGRHLGITVLIMSQYVKGVGPMIRGNCDYIVLQPIYNQTQRQTLWEMEAAFLEKKQWYALMDEVIKRENLPGNTAQQPKKKVRVMLLACFEDTASPQEKIFWWVPKCTDELGKFKLCHPKYWEQSELEGIHDEPDSRPDRIGITDAAMAMRHLFS